MTDRREDCESVVVYANQRVIDSHDHVIPYIAVAGAEEIVIPEQRDWRTTDHLYDAIDNAAAGITTALTRHGVTIAMITPWESA